MNDGTRSSSRDRQTTAGLLGLFGVGMAVCCGLPLLLGAGVVVGAAGLALGSGVVIAVGVAIGVWGWRRRQRHHCTFPGGESPAASRQADAVDSP